MEGRGPWRPVGCSYLPAIVPRYSVDIPLDKTVVNKDVFRDPLSNAGLHERQRSSLRRGKKALVVNVGVWFHCPP